TACWDRLAVYDPVAIGYTCRNVPPSHASHGSAPARGPGRLLPASGPRERPRTPLHVPSTAALTPRCRTPGPGSTPRAYPDCCAPTWRPSTAGSATVPGTTS